MINVDDALDSLKKFSYLGESKLKDGTILIGRAPHIAPFAWLHTLYPPLTEDEIANLEHQLGMTIPQPYCEFLKISNGLTVFNNTLALYGLRKRYGRSIGDAWQPLSILTRNVNERPTNASTCMFFIGFYKKDGSLLYLDSNSGSVYLCDRYDASPRFSWSSFEQMILSEIKRLIKLFDREGKLLNPAEGTLPDS
jgi:hypothetical protein